MIERLRALAGAEAVRPAAPDDAVHGVTPGAVVAPADTAACAALLAACSENGWSVEIAGARSARDAGRPPGAIDVMLSTERLRGVTEYEPDDLTIGVASGTPLVELRARVAEHRQRVPLDPPSARASIGGVLARAADGPMRLSWSTPRRQVLGLEVVTGDGRVLRVGGRVVKNVAGYDLNKLFVGSMGTLGVITGTHLRLLPMPQAEATRVIRDVDPHALVDLARALLARPAQPAVLEVVGLPWRLIVRFEGGQEAVAAAVSDVEALAATGRGNAGAEPAAEALGELARIEAEAALVMRIGTLPDRTGPALAWLEQAVAGVGTIAAHAGDGIARLLLNRADAQRIPPDRFAELVQSARSDLRGTVIVERAPTAHMRAVDPWGAPDPAVMRITSELKRQFDPAGILQRGRWIA